MFDVLLLSTPKSTKRSAALMCPDAPKKPRVAAPLRRPLMPRTALFLSAPSTPTDSSGEQNDENRDAQIAGCPATTTTTTTTTDVDTTTDTIVQHDLYDDGSTVDITTVIETTVRRVRTTVSRSPIR
jgi:hypothetical protein